MAKKARKSKMSEDKVLEILHGSTKFKTDAALVILRFDPKFIVKFLQEIAGDVDKGRVTQISQSTSAIVLICEESLAREIKERYPKYVIDHKKDLVAFTVMFPKKAVDTPGIVAFIANRFAKNGINIIEILGCYTDITFVLSRKDLFKAMDLLGEFIL